MEINVYLSNIAKINRIGKRQAETIKASKEPEVGIFWLAPDGKSVFYQDSLSISVATLKNPSEHFIDGGNSHYYEWQKMKKFGLLKDLPANLQEEYDSIPRGRVVFSVKDNKYMVYHGDQAKKAGIDDVISKFNLPYGNYEVLDDFHYSPLPDDYEF